MLFESLLECGVPVSQPPNCWQVAKFTMRRQLLAGWRLLGWVARLLLRPTISQIAALSPASIDQTAPPLRLLLPSNKNKSELLRKYLVRDIFQQQSQFHKESVSSPSLCSHSRHAELVTAETGKIFRQNRKIFGQNSRALQVSHHRTTNI